MIHIPAGVYDEQEERLSNHNQIILKMLQQGPVTNVEIAKVSKNHTARISNIRSAGYDIQCHFLDRETGLTEYRLVSTDGAKKTKRRGECKDCVRKNVEIDQLKAQLAELA